MTLTLALVPLDERPVNTRYPQMLGAIGGANVLLPPPDIRGRQREPADLPAVAEWLREAARQSQAALVSTDFLGCGNLIGARISGDSAADVLARLRPLAEINADLPRPRLFAHHPRPQRRRLRGGADVLVPVGQGVLPLRPPVAPGRTGTLLTDEEGAELARLGGVAARRPASRLADAAAAQPRRHPGPAGHGGARATHVPAASPPTTPPPIGFPSRERDWLRGWPRLIGPALADRVMMHPGADEVGSALVARLLNQLSGTTPRVWVEYAIPGDEALVAPYEDRPVRETVFGQIAACGCVPAASPDACDFVLGVATPSPRRTDYRPEYLAEDRATRTDDYARFLARLGGWQAQGIPVALADVAYPNGSDPLLTELLLAPDCPLRRRRLCAYGAWNTAGNTLGTVVAQAACALRIGDDPQRAAAQKLFLAHRFLEDYGYQSVVRREARADAEARWGRRDPDPDSPDEQAHVCRFIARRLGDILAELQRHGIGEGLSLAPGSVRLPWRRTFEVDFELI